MSQLTTSHAAASADDHHEVRERRSQAAHRRGDHFAAGLADASLGRTDNPYVGLNAAHAAAWQRGADQWRLDLLGVCEAALQAEDALQAVVGTSSAPGVTVVELKTAPRWTPPADAGRCTATNRFAARCTRRRVPGTAFCWSHRATH